MKLEQQVAGLELSQKLKSLGVKQESAFYWVMSKNLPKNHCNYGTWRLVQAWSNEQTETYAAFNCSELGEMLPKTPDMVFFWNYPEWRCSYKGFSERADTEADSRAAMLIYLIEKGIVDTHHIISGEES